MDIFAGPCTLRQCRCTHSQFLLSRGIEGPNIYALSACRSCGHDYEQHYHNLALSAPMPATIGVPSPPITPNYGTPTAATPPRGWQRSTSSSAHLSASSSKSTPIKINASSSRYLSDNPAGTAKKTSVSAGEVRDNLTKELDGNVYVDIDGMAEVYLWANRCGVQAQPLERQLSLNALSQQAVDGKVWSPPPRPDSGALLTDALITPWLTATLNAISKLTAAPRALPNIWLDTRTRSVLSGFSTPRSPDFCLLPNMGQQKHVTWASILLVGEHQSVPKTEPQSLLQLADYASQIFAHQPLRWFVPALLSYNKPPGGLRLVIFDRGGVVASRMLPLNLATLTELAAAYADIPRANLGFPPNAEDEISIIVPGPGFGGQQRAAIGKTICRRTGIVCRGTYCAMAHPATGEELLVKYSWRSEARGSEGELLELAARRGVVGVARHVAHEDVVDVAALRRGLVQTSGRALALVPSSGGGKGSAIGSGNNNTHAITASIMSTNRVYTRIVMSTIGTPIASLTSPLPVAQALLGALIGHASLYFTGRILHRDVSSSNILYTGTPLPGPTPHGTHFPLHGFLIDLDYATVYPPTQPSGAPHRTGTLPFMSIGVLSSENHTYRHDLESFLYVLLWVSTGAGIPEWTNGAMELIGDVKHSQMMRPERFETLLGRFQEPFLGEGAAGGLKEVARRWREVLFCSAHTGQDGEAESVFNKAQAGIVKPGLGEWEGFLQMKEAVERMVSGWA